MKTDQQVLEACQAHLQALQPVKKVEFRLGMVRSRAEGQLVLHTEMGKLTYFYEIKQGLSLPRLEHVLL
ncbi:MAG: hypothetical protein ACE5G5_05890, partial [Candidatus Methylomirabilales bacterium]